MRRGSLAAFALAGFIWLAGAQIAYGWAEGGVTYGGDPMDCPACHRQDFPFADRTGPHGGYVATSSKCGACHSVHEAAGGGYSLLPRQTTRDNCLVCHDGTGGYGVYGALAARGVAVGAMHRIDTTNVVPGGAVTGGSAVATFTGENGNLSCEDCHSVHGASCVETFSGERVRFHATDQGWLPVWSTNKLLRRKPKGSDRSSVRYGSDWCIGCHRGRGSGMASLANHPVDSSSTVASPFHYDRVAAVTTETSLLTTMTTLGRQGSLPLLTWSNRGFVMPTPRTADQAGHAPICQQCHEDSRIVGEPGAVAQAYVIRYGDGVIESGEVTDNPRFQAFPHETENVRMLVETGDSLCENCHPLVGLP